MSAFAKAVKYYYCMHNRTMYVLLTKYISASFPPVTSARRQRNHTPSTQNARSQRYCCAVYGRSSPFSPSSKSAEDLDHSTELIMTFRHERSLELNCGPSTGNYPRCNTLDTSFSISIKQHRLSHCIRREGRKKEGLVGKVKSNPLDLNSLFFLGCMTYL